jgi:Enterochelin esterase and related enzymes
MVTVELKHYLVQQKAIASKHLKRQVIIDLYLPKEISSPANISLLLINDGQDLAEIDFSGFVDQLTDANMIAPLLCIGIHANKDRKNEYGTACQTDFEGRGKHSAAYQRFVVEELVPFIHIEVGLEHFKSIGIAGFSLGGLSALDTLWNHPYLFSIAGVFSGSLWWRTKSLKDDYDDEKDRIMHQQIKKGKYVPGLRFYFTTGSLDETADRNNNGIIDSIDDTLALIKDLEALGYSTTYDIKYLNYENGRHDLATWGKAMPQFLMWGWGIK